MKRKLKDIPSQELYGIHGFLNWQVLVANNFAHIAKDAVSSGQVLVNGKTFEQWDAIIQEFGRKRDLVEQELFSRIDEEINFD